MAWGAFLLLLGASIAGQVGPRGGIVTDATLEIFDAPDPGALPTGMLRRGQKVVVEREEPGGWLAIRPPAGSFSWVDRAAVEELDDGRGRVIVDAAPVRPGRPGAKLPGASQVVLDRGSIVRLLDLPDLTLGSGRSARVWTAIEPPGGEARFVPAEGVEIAKAPRRPGRPLRSDDGQPAQPSAPSLDAGLREELGRIEALQRAAAAGPVEHWGLSRIRAAYADLADRATDDDARQVLRERIAQVDRQADVARAAAGFLARLRASRARDDDLTRSREGLDRAVGTAGGRFAAEGLLEPSAEELEGHRLYALIGKDGKLSAYLDLPPGLAARPLLGRKVGVTGEARYREPLPVRLIVVRDLEALDQPP